MIAQPAGSKPSYQPKKLLKLPKEMPSNIVSLTPLSFLITFSLLISQIIKSDTVQAVNVPYQMNQTEQIATSQVARQPNDVTKAAFIPTTSAAQLSLKNIDFKKLQAFKGRQLITEKITLNPLNNSLLNKSNLIDVTYYLCRRGILKVADPLYG